MKENTKDLTVVKENIFDKIKKFFKNLFKKKDEVTKDKQVENTEEQKLTKEETIENKKKEENTFANYVKVEQDTEGQRLLKLQGLIAEEVITEDELPPEDVKALHELYDRQILELKESIDEYREKILKIRMNIAE